MAGHDPTAAPDARLLLSWSGGKDSALALQTLRDRGIEPAGLLTTVTEPDGAVAHHHVAPGLLRAQAAATGLSLHTVALPDPCPNEVYEAQLRAALDAPPLAGVTEIAFGDLHLADVRAYRETLLEQLGRSASFPLWGQDTRELAERFVAEGFSAVVCVVDTQQLDTGFVGRPLDARFLADLPVGVDPCGENGEFHSFVTAGPALAHPIDVAVGRVHTDGRFARAELTLR